jgi:hypothetical protein
MHTPAAAARLHQGPGRSPHPDLATIGSGSFVRAEAQLGRRRHADDTRRAEVSGTLVVHGMVEQGVGVEILIGALVVIGVPIALVAFTRRRDRAGAPGTDPYAFKTDVHGLGGTHDARERRP